MQLDQMESTNEVHKNIWAKADEKINKSDAKLEEVEENRARTQRNFEWLIVAMVTAIVTLMLREVTTFIKVSVIFSTNHFLI